MATNAPELDSGVAFPWTNKPSADVSKVATASSATATSGVGKRRSTRGTKDVSLSELLIEESDGSVGDEEGSCSGSDESDGTGSGKKGHRRRSTSHVPVNYRGVTFVGSQTNPWKSTINNKVGRQGLHIVHCVVLRAVRAASSLYAYFT